MIAKTPKKKGSKRQIARKRRHADISRVMVDRIRVAPENERIYGPVDQDDPDFLALVESINRIGQKEPIVLTLDRVLISGHRRLEALKRLARTYAKVRWERFRYKTNRDRFLELLREFNRLRVKSRRQMLAEETVTPQPEPLVFDYMPHRAAIELGLELIFLGEPARRAAISEAKESFARAVHEIVMGRKHLWPLSDRRVHYLAIHKHVCRNTQTRLMYGQNDESYSDTTDMLTRLRVASTNGDVWEDPIAYELQLPWDCIADETRPMFVWDTYDNVQAYIRDQRKELFTGYARNLQLSQPYWIELLLEKSTLVPILKPLAQSYRLPMTAGRGFCSGAAIHEIVKRYQKSGRKKLLLLVVTDLDPRGDLIARSAGRKLRDDFGLKWEEIVPFKVALLKEQVDERALPSGGDIKQSKASEKINREYVQKYDTDQFWEVDALDEEDLHQIVQRAIDSVLDVDSFNHELDEEKKDDKFIGEMRKTALAALAPLLDGQAGGHRGRAARRTRSAGRRGLEERSD